MSHLPNVFTQHPLQAYTSSRLSWLHWVFVAAHGDPLVVASGGYSPLRSAGFSLRWLLLLQSTGSMCAGFRSCGLWALGAQAAVVVAHGLSSCGAWA